MRKEHSAADWSTRPLPKAWLDYAALDVEVLLELRELMVTALDEAGKTDWAHQEFDHLLDFEPTVRQDAWRRTSGVHRLRGRRSLAAAKALWEARDEIAARRDVTPGRIIPDAAIVAAATALPADRAALMSTPGFHGRGADRYSRTWVYGPGRRARAARGRAADAATRASTGRRTRACGPTATSSPTAASRRRARRCSRSPRSTTCRWRTS